MAASFLKLDQTRINILTALLLYFRCRETPASVAMNLKVSYLRRTAKLNVPAANRSRAAGPTSRVTPYTQVNKQKVLYKSNKLESRRFFLTWTPRVVNLYAITRFHSFIHSRIYIAPLQGNYSEVL